MCPSHPSHVGAHPLAFFHKTSFSGEHINQRTVLDPQQPLHTVDTIKKLRLPFRGVLRSPPCSLLLRLAAM